MRTTTTRTTPIVMAIDSATSDIYSDTPHPHRAKTTGAWRYQRANTTANAATTDHTSAGADTTRATTDTTSTTRVAGITPTYLWTSPAGRRYLVTPTGTTALP